MFPSAASRGNIDILGKQNELFPSGPVIKCLLVAMNVKDINISSTFLCLCPLSLSLKLHFNISKAAYSTSFNTVEKDGGKDGGGGGGGRGEQAVQHRYSTKSNEC